MPQPSPKNPDSGANGPSMQQSELCPLAEDFGAAIAEHAIRLARLYLARCRFSFDEQDIARADDLYLWANQAAEAANEAGRDRLSAELAELESELASCRLSRAAGC